MIFSSVHVVVHSKLDKATVIVISISIIISCYTRIKCEGLPIGQPEFGRILDPYYDFSYFNSRRKPSDSEHEVKERSIDETNRLRSVIHKMERGLRTHFFNTLQSDINVNEQNLNDNDNEEVTVEDEMENTVESTGNDEREEQSAFTSAKTDEKPILEFFQIPASNVSITTLGSGRIDNEGTVINMQQTQGFSVYTDFEKRKRESSIATDSITSPVTVDEGVLDGLHIHQLFQETLEMVRRQDLAHQKSLSGQPLRIKLVEIVVTVLRDTDFTLHKMPVTPGEGVNAGQFHHSVFHSKKEPAKSHYESMQLGLHHSNQQLHHGSHHQPYNEIQLHHSDEQLHDSNIQQPQFYTENAEHSSHQRHLNTQRYHETQPLQNSSQQQHKNNQLYLNNEKSHIYQNNQKSPIYQRQTFETDQQWHHSKEQLHYSNGEDADYQIKDHMHMITKHQQLYNAQYIHGRNPNAITNKNRKQSFNHNDRQPHSMDYKEPSYMSNTHTIHQFPQHHHQGQYQPIISDLTNNNNKLQNIQWQNPSNKPNYLNNLQLRRKYLSLYSGYKFQKSFHKKEKDLQYYKNCPIYKIDDNHKNIQQTFEYYFHDPTIFTQHNFPGTTCKFLTPQGVLVKSSGEDEFPEGLSLVAGGTRLSTAQPVSISQPPEVLENFGVLDNPELVHQKVISLTSTLNQTNTLQNNTSQMNTSQQMPAVLNDTLPASQYPATATTRPTVAQSQVSSQRLAAAFSESGQSSSKPPTVVVGTETSEKTFSAHKLEVEEDSSREQTCIEARVNECEQGAITGNNTIRDMRFTNSSKIRSASNVTGGVDSKETTVIIEEEEEEEEESGGCSCSCGVPGLGELPSSITTSFVFSQLQALLKSHIAHNAVPWHLEPSVVTAVEVQISVEVDPALTATTFTERYRTASHDAESAYVNPSAIESSICTITTLRVVTNLNLIQAGAVAQGSRRIANYFHRSLIPV